MELATFAAGCFWGVEEILKTIPGVINTTVGYIGGNQTDANYQSVKLGTTDHAEAVQVEFDPNVVSFSELLDFFWRLHDPTQIDRQGADIGSQYRSVIFYHSNEQKLMAEKSKKNFNESGVFTKPAATHITVASNFYPAEEYHQDYFQKNGGHVCHILRDR